MKIEITGEEFNIRSIANILIFSYGVAILKQ